MFPVVILSALVLALSGAVVVLGRQLYAVQKNQKNSNLHPALTENTQADVLRRKRERTAQMCVDIKRSLTHICTTIPSAIPGLSIERIYLLCAGELKDKAAAVSSTLGNGFPDHLLGVMGRQDLELLDEYIGQFAMIAEEIKSMDLMLAPIFKAWSGNSTASFDRCEQKLDAIARRLDELQKASQAFLCSVAERVEKDNATLSVPERIRKASLMVADSNVRAAMDDLELLARQHYDDLDRQTKARVESYYLETLELVTGELGRAEQAGEAADTRAELSIRVIHVLSNVLTAGQLTQREIGDRNLEAEVVALERLAVMRGDIVNGGDAAQ